MVLDAESGLTESYGRKFIAPSSYNLPADETEMDRLTLQHRMLKLGVGSLCFPQEEVDKTLSSGPGAKKRVLDVGTGSGIWAVEMANDFPHAEVLGIDLISPSMRVIPPNCYFELMDVMNEDIKARYGMFDLIHFRCVTGAMGGDPTGVIKNMVAALQEGGMICTAEANVDKMIGESGLPVDMKWANDVEEGTGGSWWARISDELLTRLNKIDPKISKSWLFLQEGIKANPSLRDMRSCTLHCGFDWSGEERVFCQNREQVGALMKRDSMLLLEAYRPMFIRTGMTPKEYEILRIGLIEEGEKRVVNTYTLFHYYSARKKLNNSDICVNEGSDDGRVAIDSVTQTRHM